MDFNANKPVLMHGDTCLPKGYSVAYEETNRVVVLRSIDDVPTETSLTVYTGLAKDSSPLNLGNLFGVAALACAFIAGRKSSSDFTWSNLLKPTESKRFLGYAAACFFASRYFSSAQTKPVEIRRGPSSQFGHAARTNLDLLIQLYQTKENAKKVAIAAQHTEAYGLAITGAPLLTTPTTTTTTIVSMPSSDGPTTSQVKEV